MHSHLPRSCRLLPPILSTPQPQGREQSLGDGQRGFPLSVLRLLPGRNVAVVHVSCNDNADPASVSLKEPQTQTLLLRSAHAEARRKKGAVAGERAVVLRENRTGEGDAREGGRSG